MSVGSYNIQPMLNLSTKPRRSALRLILSGSLFCVVIIVLSCSGLKLDKESNCLNDKTACFKADKTAPQYVQSVLPAPNTLVSTLPEIQLQFSEELNNPQPSDFTFTGGDLSMAITSITKIDTYTYSLRTNHNPVVGGPLTLSFQNLKDYNGNKITNGTAAFTINLNIPITIDSASHYGISGIALLPPAVPGVPDLGASPAGYQTINVSWHYSYNPVNAGNTVYTLRRSSAVDCSSGTPLAPVGTPPPNPAVGSAVATYDNTNATTITNTTYTFTINKNDIPAGRQYILICVTNAANNKNGVQFIDVTRDDIIPTMTLSPMSGIFASAKQLTFSCSDNFDRIAYGMDIKTDGSAPSAAAITDPAFDPVTGALTNGTAVTTNPFTIQTPYSTDPTKSVFKYRCIDTGGNPSVVYTSGIFDINSSYPTVNLVSVTKTGVTPAVAITGIGTGGYTSATLTWNTNQTGAAFEVRVDGSACNSGGTPLDSGAAGSVTGTPTPALTNKTAIITPATPGLTLGLNTVRVCVFGAGVWAEDSFPLLLDNSAPTLAVNVPPASYGTNQSLVFTCSDNQDKVAFTQTSSDANATPPIPPDPVISVDGVISPAELFSTPLLITTDTTGLKGKKTTVKWRCIDKAGYITGVNTATYTIDSLLPTITVQNQDHLAISTVAGAYQTAQITWVSDRSDLAYQLRRDSTNCLDGFPLTSGTNLSAGTGVLVAGTPVTSTINSNTTNFPAGDAPHTVQICVTNYAGNIGYTSRSLTLDSTPPTLPIQTPNISQIDAANFTVSWNASSDSNGIAGYRIFRRLFSVPTYSTTPDYTAVATSVTIAMPDTQAYFLKIVPFDIAGNVPAAGASYTEITTKPSISLVVSTPVGGSSFLLTDGTSSNTINANGTNVAVTWTTALGTGATYNFAFTSQPAGQVCAMKELQFGALNANVTINIICVNGYMVGGNFQIPSPAPLNYNLYRGNTTAAATSGTTGLGTFVPSGMAFNGAGTLFLAEAATHKVYRLTLPAGSVTVIAGSGVAGTADGLGAAAQFYNPSFMTSDGTNLYVSQVGASINPTNNGDAIRKIDSSGNVTTLVSGAQAIDPEGLALSGNVLYWANRSSHQIKSFNLATGVITVIAGSGAASSVDGTGTSATFNQPMSLVSLNGKLYVTEFASHRIRTINIATQAVTTLAGSSAGSVDGPAAVAQFNGPAGLISDGYDLYVPDYNSRRIRRVRLDRSGGVNHQVSTISGSGASANTNGIGATAAFIAPILMATDGRSFYVSDEGGGQVRKVTDSGLVGYWPIAPGVNPNDYNSDGGAVNNGTVISGPLGTTTDRFGAANLASTFNGTTQYITASAPITAASACNVSMAAWFKPNTLATTQGIVYNGNSATSGFGLWHSNTNGLQILLGGSTTVPALGGGIFQLTAGLWTHVAARCANGTWSLYANGHKVAEAAATATGTPPAGFSIGRDSGTAYANGSIADVRVYNRALGEGEINELAQDAAAAQVGPSFNSRATGLVSQYEFNNGAATTAAGPVGGLLTATGAPTAVAGKDGDTGGAMAYSGAGQYHVSANAAGLPSGASPRTQCVWVKPADYPSVIYSIMRYGDNGSPGGCSDLLMQDNAGAPALAFGSCGSTAAEYAIVNYSLPLNTWSHICGTLAAGNTVTIYVNGVSVATTTGVTTNWQTNPAGMNLQVGNFNGVGGYAYKGAIDDVRIYNSALSPFQIRQLATQVPSGLVARYDFTGDRSDISGFGQDLNNNGANLTADRFGLSNAAATFGGAAYFDGAMNGFPVGASPRTICAWTNPSTLFNGTFSEVVMYGTATNGWGFGMDAAGGLPNGRIFILDALGDLVYGQPHGLNIWRHVCTTYNGTIEQLYVDGTSVAGTARILNTAPGSVFIGRGTFGAGDYFNGKIDDVRIYNRALSSAEIQALVQQPNKRMAFSTTANAGMHDGGGGISGADAICASAGPNYKALVIDGTVRRACTSVNCATGGITENIDWILRPNATYLRADNVTPIQTANFNSVLPFPLLNSISGAAATRYWTGFNIDWTGAANCSSGTSWNTTASGTNGIYGLSDQIGTGTLYNFSPPNNGCNNSYNLVCVQQ